MITISYNFKPDAITEEEKLAQAIGAFLVEMGYKHSGGSNHPEEHKRINQFKKEIDS